MPELTLSHSRVEAHRDVAWQHGIVDGVVAGVVMALVLMVLMAITGDGFFRPVELLGSVWYGEVTTGAGVFFAGLFTHLALSVVFGVVFSYLMSYVRLEPVLSGLVYGALLWLVFGVLVLGQGFDYVWSEFPVWLLLVGFLSYGLALGLFEDWADRSWVHRMRGGSPGAEV